MDKTREQDLKVLKADYKVSKNKEQRRLIREAGQRIRKETGEIKSMRGALLKEHRRGRMENVRDIHAYIEGKDKYKNA